MPEVMQPDSPREATTSAGRQPSAIRAKRRVSQRGMRPPVDFATPRRWLTRLVRTLTGAARLRNTARSA